MIRLAARRALLVLLTRPTKLVCLVELSGQTNGRRAYLLASPC